MLCETGCQWMGVVVGKENPISTDIHETNEAGAGRENVRRTRATSPRAPTTEASMASWSVLVHGTGSVAGE